MKNKDSQENGGSTKETRQAKGKIFLEIDTYLPFNHEVCDGLQITTLMFDVIGNFSGCNGYKIIAPSELILFRHSS